MKKRKFYEAPRLESIEIMTEQGFAGSPEQLQWFDYGGEGDFKYGTTNDETWG